MRLAMAALLFYYWQESSRRASVVGLLASHALCACAARPDSGAEEAVRKYQRAIQRGDAAAAYTLLSEEVRRRITRAEFEQRWEELREERVAQARELALGRTAATEARVLAGDRALDLARHDG
ncbi:MAG: hypothetical protein AABZ30_09955, partial [Myxococcota bacterium]